MGIEIREVRVDEVEAAVAFAREQGSDTAAEAVTASMSLLAANGETVVGTLLTVASDDGGHAMELATAKDAEPDLARMLLDTALLKLRGNHIGKSRVRMVGSPEDAMALWSSANWTPEAIDDGPVDQAA